MGKCVFCEIVASKKAVADTIYEDEQVLVMLDIDWVIKGHILVIWKKHFENASELTPKDFEYFSEIFYKTERVLLEVLGVDKSVVLKTGGLVSHFHFHIYPVRKETSWITIKNLFDKRLRYVPASGEKEKFITDLKRYF